MCLKMRLILRICIEYINTLQETNYGNKVMIYGQSFSKKIVLKSMR